MSISIAARLREYAKQVDDNLIAVRLLLIAIEVDRLETVARKFTPPITVAWAVPDVIALEPSSTTGN
jgi:hypothetical protein